MWKCSVLVLLVSLGLGRAGAEPAAGPRDWGVERSSYRDPVTGLEVQVLTGERGSADNLYFHVSNFTADNRRVLFVSDRTGAWELFAADVDTGRLWQVTHGRAVAARSACPDPQDPRRVYLMQGPTVITLDLETGATREVGTIPEPRLGGFGQPTPSGDGQWLAVSKQVNAREWEVGRIATATGEYRSVVRQGFPIGHVQHSPTQPLIFYVWETGGFAPQRTWLVNADGSANRPFYATTASTNWITPLKEWITHEAWISGTGDMTMINDRIGVMVVTPDGPARVVREGRYWHAAARPDGRRLVIDDMEGRLWLAETATGNLRLLATGLRDRSRIHPHPSFDRQGHYVQFRTGRTHEAVALIDLRAAGLAGDSFPADQHTPP